MHMAKPSPMPSSLNTGVCVLESDAGETLRSLPCRSTWFTQDEVNTLKEDGINAVRIPVSDILSLLDERRV